MLVHHRELDSTFQLFKSPAGLLPDKQFEQAPTKFKGAQSKMLRLTDQVGLFVKLPSYINQKENVTIFSAMSSGNFRDWSNYLPTLNMNLS